MKKRIIIFIAALCCLSSVAAEGILKPVRWSVEQTPRDTDIVLTFEAEVQKGWHVYDTSIPDGGPIPTSLLLTDNGEEVKSLSLVTMQEPQRKYDPLFDMELAYFEKTVTMTAVIPVSLLDKLKMPAGELSFSACDDKNCVSDRYMFDITTPSSVLIAFEPVTLNFEEVTPAAETDNRSVSLIWIFLFGLLGGLLAIFTPCVWPIIPMTVSFFMKRSQSGRAVKDAVLYGLSIVIIYVALGLLVTVIFGASALNDISTNAVVNIFFFVLLVVFALSFFGAFEITLPSSWSTRLDNKARSTSGMLSILLMAFTLVIVSFSCTGPIIGTLLVEAAGKTLLAPALGMLGFAVALALPFSLFAMFPQWMKKLPRSGGWMDSFKVVLAFLELALSLKFFSVADLAYGWHLLDREVFLALWIVIFALLGIYLLGLFRFRHEEKTEGIGVLRFMLAVISLSFAMYMIPGLWGAPLKAISAFAPPMETQDWVSNAAANQLNSSPVLHDFDAALEKARKENKRVLVDFSGYGCVNCRKMEAKVLTDKRVEQELQNYVVVTLMVDDKTRLPEPQYVTENGKQTRLRTVGDRWSYLQRTMYGANAQPYYVKLDNNGNKFGTAYSYNEDVEQFLKWLQQ